MPQPKVRSGARVPLFARLADIEPATHKEVRPLRILGKKGVKDAIPLELGPLLNTRCPIPLAPSQDERTVVNYGIPDFSSLSPHNSSHRQKLETWIREAIVAYEPRLADVKVFVDAPAS